MLGLEPDVPQLFFVRIFIYLPKNGFRKEKLDELLVKSIRVR